MADPTLVRNVEGTATTASVSPTFTAAGAGNRQFLCVASDAYSSAPPSGWELVGSQVEAFHGLNVWTKIAAGGETTVTYTIGSATRSTWKYLEFTEVGTLDDVITAFQNSAADSITSGALEPTTGRRFLLGVTGWSTSGTTLAFIEDPTWSGEALTSLGGAIGPQVNPQVRVAAGWSVDDFTTGTTTFTATTSTGEQSQSRTSVFASFLLADDVPPEELDPIVFTVERTSDAAAVLTWTDPGDAPDGITVLRATGTHTTDGSGDAFGDVGYDPETITGAAIIAEGVSSPYTASGLSAGSTYTFAIVRTGEVAP